MPVLELDNGTRITDAIGICVYFEAIQPQPALMGESAEEKAVVTAWQRISERNGFYAVMEALRNSTPGLKSRALPGPDDYEQIPALAERGRARIGRFFEQMDARLGAERVRRRRALQHCRYHHAGVGRLRALGQAGHARALRASAPLA